MQERWYDVAEICELGHVINPDVVSYPEIGAPFCSRYGGRTIRACKHCDAAIQGDYHLSGSLTLGTFIVPAYCNQCGSPYPWTSRRIEAACELADEMASLSRAERELLKRTVLDLARDTPASAVAVLRLKRLLAKVGIGAADAFRQILVEIVTEAVRRALWGA